MPVLGLGVWQMAAGGETEQAVEWALEAGYRHVDTATMYRNEQSVGAALRRSGLPREELFVTTKLMPGRRSAERELGKSLRRLGFDVTVFASVHLSSQADADLRAFEEFVRAEPLVRECWMLSGEVDFILKCVAPDMATFQEFVTHLTAAPHVRNVRTSLVLHNSKYEAAVPLDLKVAG